MFMISFLKAITVRRHILDKTYWGKILIKDWATLDLRLLKVLLLFKEPGLYTHAIVDAR